MLRIRDTSYVTSYTYNVSESWIGGSSSSNLVHLVGTNRWMHDYPTERFKLKSATGQLFFKPMERFVHSPVLYPGLILLETRNPGPPPTWLPSTPENAWSSTLPTNLLMTGYGWTPKTDEALQAEVTRLEALAITDAYAKVGEPDVAVLTELAELNETLRFLLSPVSAMVRLTRRFKGVLDKHARNLDRYHRNLGQWNKLPGPLRKKRSPPKKPKFPRFTVGNFRASDISSAWLAYRYGLMPLIYTFQDVQKLLKKRGEGTLPTRATARAKQTSTYVIEYLPDWTTLVYAGSSFSTRKWFKGEATIVARAGVMYVPEYELTAQLGVQLNRVPKALYEAIPLSFVTDWFHNGASYYDALTAVFRTQKIHGAWVTSTVSYTLEGGEYVRAHPTLESPCSASSSGKFFDDIGKWQRRRNVTLADVKFRLRVELNGKRIADGLALIHLFLTTVRKP